jgi:tetratricopeptide (TPR) repeat protein
MSDDTLRFPEMDTISEPDEAIALHYYDSDEYQKVVEACIKRSLTEPYSIRPYEMASSVLAEEGCHADLLSHAEKGLKIRPHAPWLLNNAAYALANLDRFNEAEALLRRIDSKEVDAANAALATRGLIELRKGNTVGGFNLYVEAIRSFRSTGKRSLASAAVAYFAVAAVDLKLEAAEQIVAIAKENNKKVLQPTTTKLLARVEATITDRNSSQIAEDIARKGVASEFIDLSKIPEIN